MKILLIARKFLLEIFREWQIVILILLLPVVFLLITYFTYPGQIIQTHPVSVRIFPVQTKPALNIVEQLQQSRYPNGTARYDVDLSDQSTETITGLIEEHELVLAIDIDTNTDPATIHILGDPLYLPYYQAVSALDAKMLGINIDQKLQVDIKPLYSSGPSTNFDIFAPGMIVFAILLLTMQTAMLVTREIKNGTMQRFRLSGTNAASILAGISLAQFGIVILQIMVIGWISLLLGYNLNGSIPLAILNAVILAISAIGQGLIVGCFLENETQAATIGAIVPMIQVFISGAFFEMPSFPLFNLGQHVFNLFDIIPATESMQLFNLILSYNAPMQVIQFRFLVLILLTLLTFIAATILFQRRLLTV